VRSTKWSLAAGFLLTIAFPIVFAFVTSSHWGTMSPQDRAERHPLEIALAGVNVAQLAIAVLGVLLISAELLDGLDPLDVHRGAEAATGALGEAHRLRGRLVPARPAGRAHQLLRDPGDPRPGTTSSRSRSRRPASRGRCSAVRCT
jgi:hypothetical protein